LEGLGFKPCIKSILSIHLPITGPKNDIWVKVYGFFCSLNKRGDINHHPVWLSGSIMDFRQGIMGSNPVVKHLLFEAYLFFKVPNVLGI